MNKPAQFKYHNRQGGISMIEVLISVAIASIGLLGLAGMQATGLQSNHTAYHRSQANVLAYDMADRIRANVDTAANYLSSYTPVTLDPVTKVEIIDGVPVVVIQYPENEENQIDGCSTTGGCTAEQMARADMVAWNRSVAAALPSGTGAVTLNGSLFTVSVRWDDNRSGGIDGNDPTVQVSFRL